MYQVLPWLPDYLDNAVLRPFVLPVIACQVEVFAERKPVRMVDLQHDLLSVHVQVAYVVPYVSLRIKLHFETVKRQG